MKKEIIAVVLALVLCLGLLAGCGQKAEEPQPDAAPTDSIVPTEAPEGIELGTITAGDTADFEVSMEGEQVPITMTKHTLAMDDEGFSLDVYVDTELYQVDFLEGEFYIDPIVKPDGASETESTAIRIGFLGDMSADVLAQQELGGRRDGSTVTDEGMCKIGAYDAYHVQYTGKDFEYYESVYFIATDRGTICVSVRLDGENLEGHGPRFEAMLNTLVINNAQ